jgi:F-type H+-transporting ATPase subunit epsilon
MANRQTFPFKIITPDGVTFEGDVEELTVPGSDGELGVLPGHRPLMAALRTGIVTTHREQKVTQFATGPGFAEIAPDSVVLLTDRFSPKETVDPVKVRLELKDATDALEAFTGEVGGPEHGELVSEQLWAAAQLELYGDPPPPTFHVFSEIEARPREDFSPSDQASADEASQQSERSGS